MENLTKKELLKLIKTYNAYLIGFYEDEVHEGCTPVTIYEFFDNDYEYEYWKTMF